MRPKCLLSVGLGEPEIVLTASGEPASPPPTPEQLQPFFPQLEILEASGRPILEQYLRVEADNTASARTIEDDELARLKIEQFSGSRAVLAAALWLHLARFLPASEVSILRQPGFEAAALPFGGTRYDVTIGSQAGAWKANAQGADGQSQGTFGMTEFQEPFARLLRRFRGAPTKSR